MSKKITSKLAVVIFCFAGSFFISADLFFSGAAPSGFTGASGATCATTGCHSGNALNTTGGSVVITGIPDTYTPGTTYNFSVAITHGTANRNKWGFAVKAIGSNNSNVGSFNSTNPVAGSIGEGEIGHISAPTQSGSTYTFNNLSWTAPASPQSTEQTVRFFLVGNAANGSSSSGDFIYTTTKTITQLPSNVTESIPEIDKWIVMSASNTATVQLTMKKSAVVQAALYTLSGQEVARISSRQLASGQHKLQFETGNLAAGTYIVSLISNHRKETKKLLIQQ